MDQLAEERIILCAPAPGKDMQPFQISKIYKRSGQANYVYAYVGEAFTPQSGDTLVFENAGAYTNVMKPPFIRGGSKIISCTNDGAATLVKRDETADDLLSTYEV